MLKRLLSSIREYKWATLGAPIFVSLEVIMEVLIPKQMSRLIDEGVATGNMQVIYRLGAVLVAYTVISLICGVLSGTCAAKAGSGFAKNLRHDVFYKIQNYSFENIDKFSSSGIITRLTTDISHVQMAFQMIIRVAVRSPSMVIFSLLMAFSINKRLSLIYVAIVPFLMAGLLFIATHAHPMFEKTFKLYDKLNQIVEENLHGIRVVKSFVREEHEKEKFNDTNKDIYTNFSKAEKLLAFNAPIMQFFSYIALMLIAWFGAKHIVSETMTTGQLMSMITYSMQILMSLMMVSMIFVMITISAASARRIDELLTEEPTITNSEEPVTYVPSGRIDFENVSFSYGENKPVLKHINLSIKSGETIGIIGSTGSGKSTLVSLISRLYDPTEGTIKVGGTDVRQYELKALRDSVSVVLQKNVLFSGTIAENLRWGNSHASGYDIQVACAAAQIDMLPFDLMLDQGATNLSGGQRQRLCIARAIIKTPKVLILDDSTSAVDTATEAAIRKELSRIIPNTTKIIIAQRISSVEKCDRIVVLDKGEISSIGTHEELLKNSKIYKEVYDSQQKENKKGGLN